MLCGIYGILPQVALWGKGKLCLKGTTQALMTHRSLQTFHENRKKTVVSREDKRVAEMRLCKYPFELLSCCHNKNATNGCETKSSTFILLYKIHETICLYH